MAEVDYALLARLGRENRAAARRLGYAERRAASDTSVLAAAERGEGWGVIPSDLVTLRRRAEESAAALDTAALEAAAAREAELEALREATS